jgi:hypothetical protein
MAPDLLVPHEGRPCHHVSGRAAFEELFYLPEDLLYFRGHFPNDPLLPGVVQLNDLVLPAVTRHWPHLGTVVRLRRVKFVHPFRPGDEVRLQLTERAKPMELDFLLERDGVCCTSGILVFATVKQ